MEENVALDSKKQKKFIKSIKGIKKLINKNNEEESFEISEDAIQKPFSMRLKDSRMKDARRKKRNCGLVYLSHIPHGFYEDQMTQYFKQFGLVTNARVIRSKRTGNSKGYAFVEFKEPSVAQIVAETMNNYLMGKRLIKAVYIPPEKQRRAFRKRWNTINNPASEARLKLKKDYNADKDENAELKRAKVLLASLNKTKRRLREMGVNYDFFNPVDIPDALLDTIVKKEKDEDIISKNEDKKDVKKEKKVRKLDEDDNKIITSNKKVKTSSETNKKASNNNKIVTENEKEKLPQKITKKEIPTGNTNKKEQKSKQQKMKDAGVKPPEDFMAVEDNSDDSDSSYNFDSDEYEKVLENEDNDISSDESDVSDVTDDDKEENEQRYSKPPKKLKFEKQNQKTTKKQFKKKKC